MDRESGICMYPPLHTISDAKGLHTLNLKFLDLAILMSRDLGIRESFGNSGKLWSREEPGQDALASEGSP